MSVQAQEPVTWGPPSDKPEALWEFVNGEWKETPRMGFLATLLASKLHRHLAAFGEENQLGHAVVEGLFRLHPNGPARRPDLAFVSYDRWPFTIPMTADPAALPVVPNLAVEVNSPTNTLDEIHDKVHEYLFHGVQLVWVILPRQRYVYVHESPEEVRGLTDKRELDGGVVLPGFRLPLTRVFDATGKPASAPGT